MRELLERERELYNAALQERRDAYRVTGKSPSRRTQEKSLKEVRELRPEYAAIHTHLLQDAITRVDRAFKAFFRRCKSGEKPGYPRFKSHGRYRTFVFKDAANGNGATLVSGDKRLRIYGIGNVKIKIHRPIKGVVKQISVTLDGDGHWYASVSCDDVPVVALPLTGCEAGIDLGLKAFITSSDGDSVDNPRHLAAAKASLARAHRVVSRRKRGSNRRRMAKRLLAKQYAKLARVRRDFHNKTACEIVRKYDRIYVEDLNIKGLASGMLAKSVNDAGWGKFTDILKDKAESAGREFDKVDPHGTSIECSGCENPVPKNLSVRVHKCPHCGLVLDRDINAARVILRRGQRRRGGVVDLQRADDPRSLSVSPLRYEEECSQGTS